MRENVLLGTRKGLIVLARSSNGWNVVGEHFVGAQVTYAVVDHRTGRWWACLEHGHWGIKLHRSDDRGATWEEVPAPKYPDGSEISEGKPASTKYLWVLEPGGSGQPQRLYLGTIPGGLFVSDDSGSSWSLHLPLWNHPSRPSWFGGGMDEAGIHSILVDPRDSRHIFVGVSCAGVFETRNGGETWAPRNSGCRADFLPDPEAEIGQDPHSVAMCADHPDVLWQQNHCGVYRSNNAGEQWETISQSDDESPVHFGFVVSADPSNPDEAWIVPAVSDEQRIAVDRALCVCHTLDGGKTWQTYRQGLPQKNCYDFVFRHGLDVDGDRLLFGTATGATFSSDDRGQTWQAVAPHLPPVYSVRFA